MTAIKDHDLSDSTIRYNGVTIGGDGTDMMPPEYTLAGEPVYDDADRTITHIRYILTVNTIVYEDTESALSTRLDELRKKLQVEGKKLELDGIGVGWAKKPFDLIWGPKPRGLKLAPVGGVTAWEMIWTIEFNVSECEPTQGSFSHWMALNFETAWDYDFEGQATRIISGYIQAYQHRKGDKAQNVVDELREGIKVVVPHNFKRERTTYRENAAKNRLDFTAVDRQLTAEAFPPHITQASGQFRVGSQGIGFAEGQASLTMSITTKPGIDRSYASFVFFQAAMAKRIAMMRDGGGKIAIIADSFSAAHQMFTRTSSFSMTWQLTNCIYLLLTKKGIWEPLPGTGYQSWRSTVDGLWYPRGTSNLKSQASSDVIVNLCNPTPSAILGTGEPRDITESPVSWKWACPDIPREYSWLAYDLRLRVVRDEPTTTHRKAVAHIPGVIDIGGGDSDTSPYEFVFPGSDYSPGSDENVIENNGYPTTRVLLQFKALRVQHKPEIPVIDTIDGQKAVQVGKPQGFVEPRGDMGCHTLWYANYTSVYEVAGYVRSVKIPPKKTLCIGPPDPEGKY